MDEFRKTQKENMMKQTANRSPAASTEPLADTEPKCSAVTEKESTSPVGLYYKRPLIIDLGSCEENDSGSNSCALIPKKSSSALVP